VPSEFRATTPGDPPSIDRQVLDAAVPDQPYTGGLAGGQQSRNQCVPHAHFTIADTPLVQVGRVCTPDEIEVHDLLVGEHHRVRRRPEQFIRGAEISQCERLGLQVPAYPSTGLLRKRIGNRAGLKFQRRVLLHEPSHLRCSVQERLD
jgi:hypothetical protein